MSITPVVGREVELAALEAFLDRVPSGPVAILVTGEAGIGKTTVWHSAVEAARGRGYSVLVTRPSEAESGLPYAALGDLLADIDEGDFASLPVAQRRAIEVALLRAEPGVEPLEQRMIGVGLLAILRRNAARNPVLIAVDDAQWLDEPSANVLRFAVRRLADGALGILASVRTDRGHPDVVGFSPAVPPVMVETLGVTALTLADVDHLLHDRLGVGLPGVTLRRVHDLSGGNPFFALEIGRALIRQGALSAGLGLPVPDTLRELVLERLYHLPGPVRDVLRVVAALGRPTFGTVRAALGGDPRIDAAIGRAEDAGVIELDNDHIRFSHPLLASVLHGEAAPDARRRLHRRLAEVVSDPDERARHLALSTIEPDESVALELEAAALRTRARGAPDAAAALADQARKLTPADRPADIARRTIAAAVASLEAGASDRAAELLEPLAASATGPDQARALLILGRVRTYAAGLHSAEPLLEQAAAVAGDDPMLQAAIGRDLTTALTQTGDLRRAEAGARQTVAWAEQTGQDALVAAALVQLAMVEFLLGRGIRSDLLARAAALPLSDEEPSAGGAAAYAPADLVWGAVLKWSDAFDAARSRFEDVRRRAVAAGDETAWSSLLFQAGELELWAGAWDRAQAMADELRMAAERRPPATQQDHAYLVAALLAHRGAMTEARESAIAALAQTDLTGDLRFRIRAHALLGFIDLSVGAAHAGRDHLERAWVLFRDAAYDDPGVIRFVPDLIEARVLAGEAGSATELVGWLEERGRTLDRPYALVAAARSRAVVLGSAGRVEDGLAAIRDALDHHSRLAQPFELARTRLVQGGLLRRAKAKRDARDALAAARVTFEDLGARVWADRATAELGRIGGRAPTTTGLTPTEARVAHLAAEGYGNLEISERLFISTKTVEAHLTRIYDKLEVRSRGELARRSRSGEFPDVSGGAPG